MLKIPAAARRAHGERARPFKKQEAQSVREKMASHWLASERVSVSY